jgi:hypothetical protein
MKQGRLLVRCFHGCLEDGAEEGPAGAQHSAAHHIADKAPKKLVASALLYFGSKR